MRRKAAAVLLGVLVALSLAACQPAAEGEAGLPSAQEIVDGVIDALDNTRTYRFDADMTMDMIVEAEGEAMRMDMDMSGATDIESGQMRAELDASFTVPDEGRVDMSMDMYFIKDMMYAFVEVPARGNLAMWVKSELPGGISEQMNQIEPQIELLETAEVRVIGSDRVGGVDCYLIEVTPDPEQLWQLAMQQSQVTGQGVPEVTEQFIKEIFESFSVKQWIAKDTYFLAKAEIEMDLELTPEALGFPGEEGSMEMAITMGLLAYDYNRPVSIQLPPEAEDAMEVPSDQIFP